MKRLIRDAALLDESVDANSLSFDNVVKAIHAVQTQMGITGTTAKEAGATIAGSVGSMKAAWSNLVTGIADDNADFEGLVNNLVTTIVGDGTPNNLGVFGNILPRIEVALNGAVKLIEGLFPKIIEVLPGLISTLLPSLVSGAVNIVNTLVTALSDNKDLIFQSALDAVMTLVDGVLSMLPNIIQLGLDLIVSLLNGITAAINDNNFIQKIVDVVVKIVGILTDPETLKNILTAATTLISSLASGLIDSLPSLIDAAIQIVLNLIDFITDKKNIQSIIRMTVTLIKKISEGLTKAIPQLTEAAVLIIQNLCDFLLEPENIDMLIDMAVLIMTTIIDGLAYAYPKLIEAGGSIASALIDVIVNTNWLEVGGSIISGLWQGLINGWSSMFNWFFNAIGGMVNGVKTILGIHSPSTVFADIGKNMALGLGVGWDDAFGDVESDIENAMNWGNVDYGIETAGSSIGSFGGADAVGGLSIVQNIYSEAKSAADLMREALWQQEKAVYLGV